MFASKVTYSAGNSYSFRMNGKKWAFKKGKPEDCNDREVAKKCRGMRGFSVRVLAGSLEDEPAVQPAAAPAPVKKLVPKRVAPTKRKSSKPRKKK